MKTVRRGIAEEEEMEDKEISNRLAGIPLQPASYVDTYTANMSTIFSILLEISIC